MGSSYGQFCPVAKAMELLDERWTLLVVRELVTGTEHFNELRRGLPRMSPTLLTKRLQQLSRAGLVERLTDDGTIRYVPTPACRELEPIITALGVWGTRWVGHLGDRDLDPKLLMWDMHRHVLHDAIPPGRTVVRFTFSDVPRASRDWWLVVAAGEVDVCDDDPGHEVTATVNASLLRMTQVWRGDLTWSDALRSGSIEVSAPEGVRRAVPGWFALSPFASVPRQA